MTFANYKAIFGLLFASLGLPLLLFFFELSRRIRRGGISIKDSFFLNGNNCIFFGWKKGSVQGKPGELLQEV